MKIKKDVSRVGLFLVAALFFAVCMPIFSGCGAQKNDKCLYALNLSLNGNVLEGILNYSEGVGVKSDGKLCFCLTPNYLSACERLKNSGENLNGNSADGSTENSAEGEAEEPDGQPLKIVGASTQYELLQNGAYMLITPEVSGGSRRVKISFTVRIPSGNGRLSQTEEGINLACFYPYRCVYEDDWFTPPAACEGDPFYGDFADYDITLNVKSSFVVAGATPCSLSLNGGVATYEYSLKNRRSVAFCLSENFNVISKKCGNRSINCYFVKNSVKNDGEKAEEDADDKNGADYGGNLSENAYLGYEYYEKLTALAADCLNYFCELFGEYPYGDYSLAFAPFYCGGMEYPALSVIGKNQSVQTTLKAIVHETAHQWFPLLISNNEYAEAYFDEGLAEFAAFSYFSAKNSDLAEEMLSSARKTVINYVNNVSEKMQMNRNLNEFLSEYDYYACVYACGLLAFCEVQKTAGEAKLNSALKKFAAQNLFKRAGSNEFLSVLSHKAAKNAFLSIVEGKALLCLPK